MNREQAEQILSKTFCIDKFYDTQWEVIKRLLIGERILLIEKTGFGKSLCFQFTATQLSGTTIIFSPLIALMRDQVNKLNSLGIPVRCINSNQELEENNEIIAEAIAGNIKILYIAPERMENIDWLASTRQMNISMVVIDEAHCISNWGHDFRPAYRRIINLVNLLPISFPVLACTATATLRVEEDIKNQIGNINYTYRGNLLRENFRLFVIKVETEEEKMAWLGKNLNNLPGTGLIYTGTRVNTEIYSRWLKYLGIESKNYSADLDADQRKEVELGLLENRWKCIVSTNALGMGIDKPDIGFIIHTQIPESPIHYYQEIGRAGRNGDKTFIILFYNPNADDDLPIYFIENHKPVITKYYKVIEALKRSRLGENDIIREANLKKTEIRVIKADLIDQSIINEVLDGRSKKYEYRFDAPELNYSAFDEIMQHKQRDFRKIREYIYTYDCRMKYLTDYLGDNLKGKCNKCDNDTNNVKVVDFYEDWKEKIETFQESYYPQLEVKALHTKLQSGFAAAYYGFSNVGKTIHKCKYKNKGDFPDSLLNITIKAFNANFKSTDFDLLLYVPPTESGDLVRNFASKLARELKIKISHSLHKSKPTKPQKIFQSSLMKSENLKGVFIYENQSEINGKKILLIDDIWDSGASMKEIGKYLTSLGAEKIVPLVIAKTVGGDV
ncbi:MAG: Superfamily helicase [Ignavibacteria bacterium]|nr:Superfamily helicase [Ignavibacteria bacterium]